MISDRHPIAYVNKQHKPHWISRRERMHPRGRHILGCEYFSNQGPHSGVDERRRDFSSAYFGRMRIVLARIAVHATRIHSAQRLDKIDSGWRGRSIRFHLPVHHIASLRQSYRCVDYNDAPAGVRHLDRCAACIAGRQFSNTSVWRWHLPEQQW